MHNRGLIRGIIFLVLAIGIVFILGYVFVYKPSVQKNDSINADNSSSIARQVEETNVNACTADEECVPASCCHAKSCVARSQAPICRGIFCTQECAPGTLDCSQGRCSCIQGQCKAVIQ